MSDDREVFDLYLNAQTVNLHLTRGDTWSIPIRWTNKDLTGYTFAAQIRKTPDSTEFVSLDVESTDLPNGLIHVGQSVVTELGGYWDLQATPPGGLPRTRIKGAVFIDKDVTR